MESNQILSSIMSGVKALAEAIGDKIEALNGGPPSAVVLIGGGSLTPCLPKHLAACLGLSEQRVAVRGREVIPNLSGELEKLQGPACITPLGIAITSMNDQALNLLHVEVNKRPIRLFSLCEGSVGDALLAAGFDLRKLQGKPGRALSVTVNGKSAVVRGEPGVAATIRRNGETVDLETRLHPNDCLEVTAARDGAEGKGVVQDVIPYLLEFNVRLNAGAIKVTPRIKMNGSLVTVQTPLIDRAEIVWEPITTVAGLLDFLEIEPPLSGELSVSINGQFRRLKYTLGSLLVNGRLVEVDTPLYEGDRVELTNQVSPHWRVRDVAPQTGPAFVDITLNGSPRSLPGPRLQIRLNSQPVYGDEILRDGDQLEYKTGEQDLIFSDLFRYLDVQPDPPPGKSHLIMGVNGHPAEFNTSIKTGDILTLEWK